jgi:hypothetical protein
MSYGRFKQKIFGASKASRNLREIISFLFQLPSQPDVDLQSAARKTVARNSGKPKHLLFTNFFERPFERRL